jgi:hypothetical protein
LPAVLSTRDPNIDSEDGHPIAYQAILQSSDGYEKPPVSLREDSEPVVSDPIMSGKVPEWMASAEQMATGERQRVLEDGDDKISSSDEDDPNMKPDTLTGMYTSEMNPKQGPKVLSSSEAARQKAVGQLRKQHMILSAPRVESPQPDEIPEVVPEVRVSRSGGSSDDDTLKEPEYVYSVSRGEPRRNKAWTRKLADAALALPAPELQGADDSATRTRSASRIDSAPPSIPKAAAPLQAPAGKSTKKKPMKGQESPVAKATHPIATRRTQEASGAGILRGGVASGQTGYVCGKLSPSSKPGS